MLSLSLPFLKVHASAGKRRCILFYFEQCAFHIPCQDSSPLSAVTVFGLWLSAVRITRRLDSSLRWDRNTLCHHTRKFRPHYVSSREEWRWRKKKFRERVILQRLAAHTCPDWWLHFSSFRRKLALALRLLKLRAKPRMLSCAAIVRCDHPPHVGTAKRA